MLCQLCCGYGYSFDALNSDGLFFALVEDAIDQLLWIKPGGALLGLAGDSSLTSQNLHTSLWRRKKRAGCSTHAAEIKLHPAVGSPQAVWVTGEAASKSRPVAGCSTEDLLGCLTLHPA